MHWRSGLAFAVAAGVVGIGAPAAVATPSPLTATPHTINFGHVMSGSSAESVLTVTNTSSSPVTLWGMGVGGEGSYYFTMPDTSESVTTCMVTVVTLVSGESCVVEMGFQPPLGGHWNGFFFMSVDPANPAGFSIANLRGFGS